MNAPGNIPNQLGRIRSLPYLTGIALNPLVTTRRLHAEHGAFAILSYPHSRRSRPQILPCIADARLYESITSTSQVWRPTNVSQHGLQHHASNRLAAGMTRMRGAQHAHYRPMLTQLLSRRARPELNARMAEIAEQHIASWPTGVAVDLLPLIDFLVQDLAIAVLFPDDQECARRIAKMISRQWATGGWIVPRAGYFTWLRTAAMQEAAILDWAAKKRGTINAKNFLSVMVNSPDENGASPNRQIIAGLLSFTFGASYETSQAASAWALLLLSQHPQIAADLTNELHAALRGDVPEPERIEMLPLLNGVVKEAMRLFPPVPIQFRRSMAATALGAVPVERGVRVLINAHLINRDPTLYKEPDRFCPERWTHSSPSPFEYPVFGAGPRMCPGFQIGDQMVKLVLAAILTRYRVEAAREARIGYRSGIILAPYPALPMVLRELSEAPVSNRVSGRVCELMEMAT